MLIHEINKLKILLDDFVSLHQTDLKQAARNKILDIQDHIKNLTAGYEHETNKYKKEN